MSYALFFTPEKVDSSDSTSDTILVPVIINHNGETFAMRKTVKTVSQAFMVDAGFTLAQFIEAEGGFDSLKAVIDAREDDPVPTSADLERAE